MAGKSINKVALIGAGAVGGMLSSYFWKAYSSNFFLIATGSRADRLRANGLTVNRTNFKPPVADAAAKPDLLLVCVKNYDLPGAINDMRQVVTPETIILPILSGITATERLKEAFPRNEVLYGIMMRTDAERSGGETRFTVSGELQFGEARNEVVEEPVTEVKDCLDKAGIANKIYPDMVHMLWRNWMIDIGANQISMLAEAEFKYFGLIPEISDAVRVAISEIAQISESSGIGGLHMSDVNDVIMTLINYPPEEKSSMLQDFEARRQTEIDAFAGYVIELGARYGVPTPTNYILYKLIKARERKYLDFGE
jgi:2-dehydropantoate 2-reductase